MCAHVFACAFVGLRVSVHVTECMRNIREICTRNTSYVIRRNVLNLQVNLESLHYEELRTEPSYSVGSSLVYLLVFCNDIRNIHLCMYRCMYLREKGLFSSSVLYLGLFWNMNDNTITLATEHRWRM